MSAVDEGLQLYGTFRIWVSIIVGAIVAIISVGVFIWTFYADNGFEYTDGTVEDISCSPYKETRQTSKHSTITTDKKRCIINVHVTHPKTGEEKVADITNDYNSGLEPEKGDSIDLWVNSEFDVRSDVFSKTNLYTIRLVCAVIFFICILIVITNLYLRNNTTYKRVQGTLGAVDTVASAFD